MTRLGWKVPIYGLKVWVLVQVGKKLVHKHIENRCSVLRIERFGGACETTPESPGMRLMTHNCLPTSVTGRMELLVYGHSWSGLSQELGKAEPSAYSYKVSLHLYEFEAGRD